MAAPYFGNRILGCMMFSGMFIILLQFMGSLDPSTIAKVLMIFWMYWRLKKAHGGDFGAEIDLKQGKTFQCL